MNSSMNKILSTKAFFISHFLILLISLLYLALFYYVLYGDQLVSNPLTKYRAVTTKPTSLMLELTNPDDELWLFEKSHVVSGRTNPKATVIISNQNQNFGLQADSSGEFSKVVDLSKGLNEIEVAVFDELGNTKTDLRTIYYSEEKL